MPCSAGDRDLSFTHLYANLLGDSKFEIEEVKRTFRSVRAMFAFLREHVCGVDFR